MTTENVVRRNLRRELPVALTDREYNELARFKANLELERDEMEAAFAEHRKGHAQRLEDVELRIGKAGAELRVGEQKRVVECLQRYVKTGEHAGKVETVRLDTGEVVERHHADLLEARQAVPEDDDVADSILDQAAKMQRDGNVEETDDGDITVPDAPAAKSKKKRKAKR